MATPPEKKPPAGSGDTPPVLSTLDLAVRARNGDSKSLNELCGRYLQRLSRWAHGRLPASSRALLDTEDLVQEAIVKTVRKLDTVAVENEGVLQAYFRRAIMNRIRDQVRWSRRRENVADAALDMPDPRATSPLENVMGRDDMEAYEGALARLDEGDQLLIHLRLELDYGFSQIAGMTGRPSADAARMALNRAVRRLCREMRHDG